MTAYDPVSPYAMPGRPIGGPLKSALNPDYAGMRGYGRVLDRLSYFCLGVFIFALPFADGMALPEGFAVVQWFGILAFGIAGFRSLAGRTMRSPIAVHLWLAGFVAWVALSLLWSCDPENTTIRVGTYVQLMVAIWLIWELARTESRVEGLLQAYVWGSAFAAAITLYNFLNGETAGQMKAGGNLQWDESRFTVAGLNENDLGLMLALSIPMTIYLLTRKNGRLLTALLWIPLALAPTAILLTASRGSLLAAAAGLSILPAALRRMSGSNKIMMLIAMAAVAVCGAYVVPAATWTRILELGTELEQGTLTHRTVIWAAGWEVFRQHPWVGIGSGAYGAAVVQAIDVPYVAHNTFVSILVELGVVGAMLFAAVLGSLFFCISKMRRLERYLWMALMATWGIGVSTLTWEYRKPTWLIFGLLAAHACARLRGAHQQGA